MTVIEFIEARLIDSPETLSEPAAAAVRRSVDKHVPPGGRSDCPVCDGGDVDCPILYALAWLWDNHPDYESWKS